ncbi:uncharacterized protein LOC129949174 [Eupeodes corollae]|uniref:uncharacterized protein LOC129949174 n=1 Tax=Eupeodes corollae TaxID=290404 RepID=UPI00249036C5|nr:uncharacterized protein LOC129949174 [Eupeodes corollae]
MNTSKLVILCVIVSFLATAYAVTSSWGSFAPSSQLLYVENIANLSVPKRYVNREVRYLKNGSPNGRMITGIRAIDQVTNGTGGHATLYSGGPGFTYVLLKLQSQYNYGLLFRVEIYGR